MYLVLFLIGSVVCLSDVLPHEEIMRQNLKHGKILTVNSSEFIQTMNNYQENYKQAERFNHRSLKNGAKNGVTKFSHLSFQDFKELYLSDLLPRVKPINHTSITSFSRIQKLQIPQRLDWRSYLNYSIISAVKNQKKCGGCWAFSTVETVESMYSKGNGQPPIDLSVQQVIDCTFGAAGCAGGDTCTALHWMVNSKTPIVTNAEYPLTDQSNFCKMMLNSTRGVQVKDYKCYRHIGEDQILQLLQNGPLVAAVDATTWKNYQGGIIQYHCDAFPNHAVQIIGYDLTGEVPYYIVRNSWGDDFGHNGYIYIKVGDNLCGIASEISTVTV